MRGITIYTGTSPAPLDGAALPIVIIGLAASTATPVNTITKVANSTEAIAKFGSHVTGDTIPRTLDILLRYGCNNIYVIRCTDAASIPGSDTAGARTGIYLAKDIPSKFNLYPAFLLVPGQNSDAVVTAAVATATAIRSYAIIDPADGDTIATIVTTRGGTTGIGQDNERLIVAYPYMKNAITPATREPLSAHIAGSVAKNGGYSKGISSLGLLGVLEPSVTISMSLTDPLSDTSKLNEAGVVTIMLDDRVIGGYETWGDRNTLYPSVPTIRSSVTAVRTEDAVLQRAVSRARKFLDMPSSVPTANLGNESLNAMFYEMSALGELKGGSSTWIPQESDLATGKLKYSLKFQPNIPVEMMELAVYIGA
jgi:uncharacterized protein